MLWNILAFDVWLALGEKEYQQVRKETLFEDFGYFSWELQKEFGFLKIEDIHQYCEFFRFKLTGDLFIELLKKSSEKYLLFLLIQIFFSVFSLMNVSRIVLQNFYL